MSNMHINDFVESSQQLYKVETIISPILLMRKLRLSKVRLLDRGYTARKPQKPIQIQARRILELMFLHSFLLAFHLAGPLHLSLLKAVRF